MTPETADDATLIGLCKAGRSDAWNVLVRRYQNLVFAIVRRARFDEHAAGDVLQTVFLRLYENLDRIRQPERLHAWIVTTAKREVLLALRHADRSVSLDALQDDDQGGDADQTSWDPPADDPLPEDLLDQLQQHHCLSSALGRLDERCRQLLLALFADEEERLSYNDLAQKLGLPVGSLGPTRLRCLGKLRGLMG